MSGEPDSSDAPPEPQTFAVLVLAYSLDEFPQMTYAMLRSEQGWRVLSGRGQRGEQPIDAARRHALRTIGAPPQSAFVALDLRPPASTVVPGDADGVPEYAFAALVDPAELAVPEQSELSWVSYDVAHHLLRRDSERHALWDLRRRIARSGQRPDPRRTMALTDTETS